MTRSIAPSLVLLLSLAASATAASPSGETAAEPGPQLTVRLYDYAKPSDAILSRAKRQTEQVLAGVGIVARWLHCPLTMEELEANPSCNDAPGPADLVIRLLPPQMRATVSNEGGTFGYALIGDNPAPRNASVLFGNVEQLAWQRDQDPSYGPIHRSGSHERYVGILLGHVIAHEIGHLLLATNQHSRHGLMQAHWGASATRDAVLGRLLFEPREQSRIRRQMAERERRAEQ